MLDMRRRELITLVGSVVAAWLFYAQAHLAAPNAATIISEFQL
jgi:hypothetical protein